MPSMIGYVHWQCEQVKDTRDDFSFFLFFDGKHKISFAGRAAEYFYDFFFHTRIP